MEHAGDPDIEDQGLQRHIIFTKYCLRGVFNCLLQSKKLMWASQEPIHSPLVIFTIISNTAPYLIACESGV